MGTLSLERQEGRSQDGNMGLTRMERSPSAPISSLESPLGTPALARGTVGLDGPWDGH